MTIINILITAGGTREDIDPVRGITNYATGRLGSLIAEEFIQRGASVTYICAETAVRPQLPPQSEQYRSENLNIITIRNTAQLLEKMEQSLHNKAYNAVIHSMAVSDYTPYATSTEKISSKSKYLVVVLEKLPKVIRRVKEIQPNTLLIGFKLLTGAGESSTNYPDELIRTSHKLMAESHADYVLANAQEDIYDKTHKALLIGKDGIIERMTSKKEIAEVILKVVESENKL